MAAGVGGDRRGPRPRFSCTHRCCTDDCVKSPPDSALHFIPRRTCQRARGTKVNVRRTDTLSPAQQAALGGTKLNINQKEVHRAPDCHAHVRGRVPLGFTNGSYASVSANYGPSPTCCRRTDTSSPIRRSPPTTSRPSKQRVQLSSSATITRVDDSNTPGHHILRDGSQRPRATIGIRPDDFRPSGE